MELEIKLTKTGKLEAGEISELEELQRLFNKNLKTPKKAKKNLDKIQDSLNFLKNLKK